MSTLESRIAEVLAQHVAKQPWSDSGVMKCSCGERFVAEYDYQQRALHQAHVAAVLAPVIREREAEAWDAGYMRGRHPWTRVGPFVDPIPEGASPPQTGTNTNPYRSNDE